MGQPTFRNEYTISIKFTSKLNGKSWLLTTIYPPCTPANKRAFLNWFRDIQMPPNQDWLVVGGFQLNQKTEYRNKEGADASEMFLFNEAINKLGLIELPLFGR